MNKIYNEKRNIFINIYIILSFIFFSFLSIVLLFKANIMPGGWDLQFHLRRILEFKESISHNFLFPNFSFNQFHGSAVMNMYPYFNLFPIAIISFVVKSKINLMYTSFIVNTFLTFIISFYSNKSYTKSNINAYIFSIIYGLSNMFLSYYFLLTDFGISSTFTFLPLVIFNFINIIKGNKKNNWILLSLGMSLILFSHILNVLIIGFLLFIWLLINIKRIDKMKVIEILKSILLFLFLTSIIWMPLLSFLLNNYNNIHMPFASQLTRIPLKEFMRGIYGGKSVWTIGFFPLITLLISCFFYKKFTFIEKQMYSISLIIVLCSLFFPFEIKIFRFLDVFQNTYRFLIIPIMFLSYIFAFISSKCIKRLNKKGFVVLLIVTFTVLLQLFVGQYLFISRYSNNYTVDHYIKRDNELIHLKNYKVTNTSQVNRLINSHYDADDDYIPKSAFPISSYVNRNIGFFNNYHKIKISHTGYNTLNFFNKNNINELSLPIYAYNKEKLYIYLNGRKVKNYANKNGLLTLDNVQNNVKLKNKIYIKPIPDPFRIIGVVLSIFVWLFTLGIIIKRKFIH